MNPFTRRSFLRKTPVAAAAVTLPAAVVVAENIRLESQEQKCARLLGELLTECRKLPHSGRSQYGYYVDLPPDLVDGHVRYTTKEGGDGEMLVVIL